MKARDPDTLETSAAQRRLLAKEVQEVIDQIGAITIEYGGATELELHHGALLKHVPELEAEITILRMLSKKGGAGTTSIEEVKA